VRPRPPTLTSIPSLLGVFQHEWDALALEAFTLKKALAETRQELSTALYHHDAAVRVIARLTKERDEARDALSKVTVGSRVPGHADAMQVDRAVLSDGIIAKINKTQEAYFSICPGSKIILIDMQIVQDPSKATSPRRLGNSGRNLDIQAYTYI